MTKSPWQYISQFAVNALLAEVTLSPKPGLVDLYDNGAHDDMTIDTFKLSIQALKPFFEAYCQLGWRNQDTPFQLFQQVRRIGIKAEQAMLDATQYVNTHKGANFSFAVLLSAASYHAANHLSTWTANDTTNTLAFASKMTSGIVEQDFKNLQHKPTLSYGESLYLHYGLTGIRGEAAAGYPTLQEHILPFVRRAYDVEPDVTHIWLQTLVYLMSIVEDGNILHRGGYDAWQTIKQEAIYLHQQALSKHALHAALQTYNRVLVERHLSPGGSADLLALAMFFAQMEGYHLPQQKEDI